MYAAVDIGGTKTLVAVFDGTGNIVERIKFPTPVDYDEFILGLSNNVANLSTKDFQYGCVAAPGRVDRRHGIGLVFGNLPWQRVPLEADLEKIFACPFLIENDANLAGLSEALLLKDEFKKVLYVTISTGIGGIYIINGKMQEATIDAEVGSMLLEHEGKLERWEHFASGKAITAKYGKRASDITDPQAWYAIAHNIAIGLIDLIATYTPEVIVIGGGVGTNLPKFQDRLEENLRIYDNPLLTLPAIRAAQRPEEAVVYGCYDLIKARHHGKTTR